MQRQDTAAAAAAAGCTTSMYIEHHCSGKRVVVPGVWAVQRDEPSGVMVREPPVMSLPNGIPFHLVV